MGLIINNSSTTLRIKEDNGCENVLGIYNAAQGTAVFITSSYIIISIEFLTLLTLNPHSLDLCCLIQYPLAICDY